MDKYNLNAMRNSADAMASKLKKLEDLCQSCDSKVKQLNASFDDDAYRAFASKYASYQPTMKSMQECLQQYIAYMNKSVETIERFVGNAASKLN